MKTKTANLIPARPPPLQLTRTASSQAANLDPHVLSIRATKISSVLKEILAQQDSPHSTFKS